MVNKVDVEYALLLHIVQEKDFDALIINDITEEMFSDAGRVVYRHIKDYLDTYNEYMHVNNVLKFFSIDPERYTDLVTMGDTKFLIDTLKSMYASEVIRSKLSILNSEGGLVESQPYLYIEKFSEINDSLQEIGWTHTAVNIIDNLDNVLQIDRNNVIKTGFKELDEKLIGWNRGEELAVLMGRPRTR